LIDEEEFQVKPAIQRVTQLFEVDTRVPNKKRNKFPKNPDEFDFKFLFLSGVTILVDTIDFTANMNLVDTDNVQNYDVYINNNYYGSDVNVIQITTNDVLRVEVTKTDNTLQSVIQFENKLV